MDRCACMHAHTGNLITDSTAHTAKHHKWHLCLEQHLKSHVSHGTLLWLVSGTVKAELLRLMLCVHGRFTSQIKKNKNKNLVGTRVHSTTKTGTNLFQYFIRITRKLRKMLKDFHLLRNWKWRWCLRGDYAAACLRAKAICRKVHSFFMELHRNRSDPESRKASKGSGEAQRQKYGYEGTRVRVERQRHASNESIYTFPSKRSKHLAIHFHKVLFNVMFNILNQESTRERQL